MSTQQLRILCLSNGHGEDRIAVQVASELHQLGFDVSAMPIVGRGDAYRRQGISIVGPIRDTMPSGGFLYMDWKQLLGDIRGGLASLTLQQMRAVRQFGIRYDLVLAVGDIVVQLMAYWSRRPYVFIGTAKSDYFIVGDRGPYSWWNHLKLKLRKQHPLTVYAPWERWLMHPRRCLAVFPRDSLTSSSLQHYGLPVFDMGNPMMDNLEPADFTQASLLTSISTERPALLLLPGSRSPEAYRNWSLMADTVRRLPNDIWCYAALAPQLDCERLQNAWPRELTAPVTIQGHFAECAQRANVVLGMSGTANEQCVGLGKPVITIPGVGPQFTYKFAETQRRLLGRSVTLAKNPEEAAIAIQRAIEYSPDLMANAIERMGTSGASRRIACKIQRLLV
ncbi:MAG: lipid-A-disaccharide synthase-related protein [Cyanobacteria bacterium P01_E01_bin.34]